MPILPDFGPQKFPLCCLAAAWGAQHSDWSTCRAYNFTCCGQVEELACAHCAGQCRLVNITFQLLFMITVWFVTLLYCDHHTIALHKIKVAFKKLTHLQTFLVSTTWQGLSNVVGNLGPSSGWALTHVWADNLNCSSDWDTSTCGSDLISRFQVLSGCSDY